MPYNTQPPPADALERQRRIAQAILYAGLGALEHGDRQELEELMARGRALTEPASSPPASGEEAKAAASRAIQELADTVEEWARTVLDEKSTRTALGAKSLSEIVESWIDTAPRATGRMGDMIDAMTPRSVPTAPAVLQARRNSAARTALIEEHGLLTSADIADLNRSEAENRSALASRWKREGRIFSVQHHGKGYFPGYQLQTDGLPRPVIADILEALGETHGWETALWFTAANGYLDGARPVDLLSTDPAAVVEAATHEGAETYF